MIVLWMKLNTRVLFTKIYIVVGLKFKKWYIYIIENIVLGTGMAKLIKLLLVVIFLAGCTSEPEDDACSYPNTDNYTIKRAANGVYIYKDNLNQKDMKVYF